METIKIKKDGEWIEVEISKDSFQNIKDTIPSKFKEGDWVIITNGNG